ncbi:MAG: amidohydrolase family protein [Planctomycetota bacterium]
MRRLDTSAPRPAPVRPSGGALRSAANNTNGPAKWVATLLLALLPLASLTPKLAAQPGGTPIQILRIGVVHPVSGPAIEDALIVIQGDRILQIRPAGGRVPQGTLSFPEAHAYPGFVDLHSSAFADGNLLADRNVDAAAEILPGLDPFDTASQDLVRHGVTTAYVHNRSQSAWRGQGAVIRPGTDGFDELGGDQPMVLHYRIDTSGAHPLQRLQQLEGLGNEFEQLEKYEESLEKFEEEKEKYEEELAKYLSYHRKKNGIPEPEEEPEEPTEETEEEGESEGAEGEGANEEASGSGEETTEEEPPAPRRRRGRNGGQGRQGGGEQESSEEGSEEGGDGDDAPKKPKYPREPKRDRAKEALIKLRDGEARWFVEARHPDDIRRATEIISEQELGDSVLEAGDAAAACIDDIASYFRGVVVTQVAPREKSRSVPESAAGVSIPVLCEQTGVPVAIASGSVSRARHLRTIAAEAIGLGLSEHTALRAITLTPAEFLGIEDRVGSLEAGKVADMTLFSGPIFDPTSRPVAVFRSGTRIPLDQ